MSATVEKEKKAEDFREFMELEGNFLWTYAKKVYEYRDQFVSKFLEDAAEGNDALKIHH